MLQPLPLGRNTKRIINLQRNHRRKFQRYFDIGKRMTGSRTHNQIQSCHQRAHHHHHCPNITEIHTQQSSIPRLQIQKFTSEACALHHPVLAHNQPFRDACGTRSMYGNNRRSIKPLIQEKIQIPQGRRAITRPFRHKPGYIFGSILFSL